MRLHHYLGMMMLMMAFLIITACDDGRKPNPAPVISTYDIVKEFTLPCSSTGNNNKLEFDLPPGKIKKVMVERTDNGRHCKIETEISTGIRMPGLSKRKGTMFPVEPGGNKPLKKIVFPNKGTSKLDELDNSGLDQNGTNPREYLTVTCGGGGNGMCQFKVTVTYESFTINTFSYVYDDKKNVTSGMSGSTTCHANVPSNPQPTITPNFTSAALTSGFYAVALFSTGTCPVTVKFAGENAPAESFGTNPVAGLDQVGNKNPRIGTFSNQNNVKVMAYCTSAQQDACAFDLKIIPLKSKP